MTARGAYPESRAKYNALKLLCMQKLSGMHSLRMLDLRRMKTDMPVTVGTVQSYIASSGASAEEIFGGLGIPEGITLRHNGVNIILYDEAVKSPKRIRWTIAHEIGHIMCGHSECNPEHEREANEFAAQLLLPDCVIEYLEKKTGNKISPEKLARLFSVSLGACRVKRKSLDSRKPLYTPEIHRLECRLIDSIFRFSEGKASVEELEQRWFDPEI